MWPGITCELGRSDRCASLYRVCVLARLPPPPALQGHSTEFLRDIVHLRPRTNLIGAVARVRHTLAEGLRMTLAKEEFVEVNTPLITSNDCEGAGELFRLVAPNDQPPRTAGGAAAGADQRGGAASSFFGSPAFLTVRGSNH